MGTKVGTSAVAQLQATNSARAIQVEGRIINITNGTANDGSASRCMSGVPTPSDIVRIDVSTGTRVVKNIRVNAEKLVLAGKANKVSTLIGANFMGSIVELKAGESAVVKGEKGELSIIKLENDRVQIAGSYYILPSQSERDANAYALAKSLMS